MSSLNISKNQGFRPMLRPLSFHLSKQICILKMEKKKRCATNGTSSNKGDDVRPALGPRVFIYTPEK